MTYVALLRGINVGGNNKIDMKQLQALFEKIGFTDVQTYINSGNVIFSSDKGDEGSIARLIEKSIEKEFEKKIPVLIRSKRSIQKVCAAIPSEVSNGDEYKADVLFLWDTYDDRKTLTKIQKTDVDTLNYVSGAIIWYIDRSHYSESGMHTFIGTEVYKHMTARNVNTVRKIAALMK